MADKSKTPEEEYGPIYVQSSNPTPELLAWIAEQSEEGKLVYLQSGNPNPPPPPPGGGK